MTTKKEFPVYKGKLTEAIITAMCEIVKIGNFRKVAAASVGMPTRSMYTCLKRGQEENEKILAGDQDAKATIDGDFAIRFAQAEAEAESTMVKSITSCDNPAIQLAFLRCRHGVRYNNNPNAHLDDETGNSERKDLMSSVLERLACFIPKDDG